MKRIPAKCADEIGVFQNDIEAMAKAHRALARKLSVFLLEHNFDVTAADVLRSGSLAMTTCRNAIDLFIGRVGFSVIPDEQLPKASPVDVVVDVPSPIRNPD